MNSKLQAFSGNISSSELSEDNNKKGIEKHKRMYKDASISAPYSHQPLHVPNKLKLPRHTDTMECVCSYTGIVISLEVPRIEGYAFTYQNPLSIYANVKGMIQQGISYLHKLDVQVLAGMYITAYRHYDLLEAYSPKAKISSAAMNAMLRTAGKDILVEALDFVNLINSKNCSILPAMSLDYQAHKNAMNMAPAIKEYIKLLRGILFPEAIPSKDKALLATVSEENMRITERNDNGIVERRGSGSIKVYTGKNRRTSTLSEEEQEFEDLFKRNKKQAKLLLHEIEEQMMFSPKFIGALRHIISNRNLIMMSHSFRTQFIEKLEEKPCSVTEEMIKIIRDSENKKDIFGDIDDVAESSAETKEAIESTVSKPMSALERFKAIKEAKRLEAEKKD
jgi:hypothetical protein